MGRLRRVFDGTMAVRMSLLSGESFPNSFEIERNTIVETVVLLIMNTTEVLWVHNQKENCPHDQFPSSLKGIVNITTSGRKLPNLVITSASK